MVWPLPGHDPQAGSQAVTTLLFLPAMKYRKKPVVIEAFEFSYSAPKPWPQWLRAAHDLPGGVPNSFSFNLEAEKYQIETLEGEHLVSEGDFIIQGIKGELYPCKPDIFALTYEPVTE
jgi:hypothetical protein